MAKIGVKIGLTLRLTRENDFQFIRPEISIEEIDTEKDVKSQLDETRKALELVWDEAMYQTNDRIIKEMPNVGKEIENSVMTQLKNFKKQLADLESLVKVGKV